MIHAAKDFDDSARVPKPIRFGCIGGGRNRPRIAADSDQPLPVKEAADGIGRSGIDPSATGAFGDGDPDHGAVAIEHGPATHAGERALDAVGAVLLGPGEDRLLHRIAAAGNEVRPRFEN